MENTCCKAMAVAVCMVLAGMATGGCQQPSLWGDTASSKGDGFSTHPVQWAYDGELVNFDFWPARSGSHYVVFECEGKAVVVQEAENRGFLWTRSFKAGDKPKEYSIWATSYMRRGRYDWVYDKTTKEWYEHVGYRDRADSITGEKGMTIRCYRIQLKVPVPAPAGKPKAVTLKLTKEDGTSIKVPRRKSLISEERGFVLVGPDEEGKYEVRYTPTHNEVNRTGFTDVVVLVEHPNGKVTEIKQRWRTP